MSWKAFLKSNPYLIKLFNFEYWSSSAFYLPLMPYFFSQSIKHRHLFFFTITNPGLEFGGLGLESKYETLLKLPKRLRPKSILVDAKMTIDDIENTLAAEGINYPIIIKPDVGFRGFLVKKIMHSSQLAAYLEQYPTQFILQEYISLPEEVGVFYYRFPNESKGVISSITLKEFLAVEGDGISTVKELIEKNPRALLQLERLTTDKTPLSNIPPKGTKIPLGVIGNHSKGTRFINGNHLINDSLSRLFDQISQEMGGFFYGRFDIKCKSFDDLSAGRDFVILEVNGVCSEPTHIYDADHSNYFKSLKEIKEHWTVISRISLANRQLGLPYENTKEVVKDIWKALNNFKKIKRIKTNL